MWKNNGNNVNKVLGKEDKWADIFSQRQYLMSYPHVEQKQDEKYSLLKGLNGLYTYPHP